LTPRRCERSWRPQTEGAGRGARGDVDRRAPAAGRPRRDRPAGRGAVSGRHGHVAGRDRGGGGPAGDRRGVQRHAEVPVCPPGLAPISFGPAALEALKKRKDPVVSWYLDMGLVGSYWGAERKYHHTAPINMIYALREPCVHCRVRAGGAVRPASAQPPGLGRRRGDDGPFDGRSEAERLPMLNAIRIPDGADDKRVRRRVAQGLRHRDGAGLGEFAGKVWRIGIMGHASAQEA